MANTLKVVLQGKQSDQSIASHILRGQTKSYGLLEVSTAPELTINRVCLFNLSSFLSYSPENLTSDSIQENVFGVF